jgi:hypothetical protein
MTTARDLLTITMDIPSAPSVRRGDLSLGLAAAELIDLLRLGAAGLAADRIVPVSAVPVTRAPDGAPGPAAAQKAALEAAQEAAPEADGAPPVEAAQATPPVLADPLLAQAAAALMGEPPHETVEDWLWRRGRGLPTRYLDVFEAEGQLARERRRRWGVFGSSRMVLVDSAGRRRAAHRWSADEPVLVALAAAVGTGVLPAEGPARFGGGVDTVLAVLHQAVAELAEERLRRARRRDEARVTTLRRGY